MQLRHVVAGVLALASTAIAQAVPITFGFSGSVTQVPADDPGGGSAITGTYTFDDAVLDAIADPSQGSYASFGLPFGLSVQIGTNSYSLAGFLNIAVSDGVLGVDQYGVFAFDGGLTVSMLFTDLDAAVFASDALPSLPPTMAAFEVRDFHLSDTTLGDVQIDGQIDTLVCQAGCNPVSVPEPGTSVLVVAGLLAGGLRRRLFG